MNDGVGQREGRRGEVGGSVRMGLTGMVLALDAVGPSV